MKTINEQINLTKYVELQTKIKELRGMDTSEFSVLEKQNHENEILSVESELNRRTKILDNIIKEKLYGI